jgi:hypothetical protein
MSFVQVLALGFWCVFVPCLLARRGNGSRWIWFGAGISGFLLLCLYSILWDMNRQPTNPGCLGFDPVSTYPLTLPLGGADAYCFVLAFGFMLAGTLYTPKLAVSGLFGK